LPRRWRLLRQLPLNSQGKLPQAEIEALLLAPRPKAPEVLEQVEADGEWTLQLSIPPDLAYFSGHFPVTPVLPGVVQVEWAFNLGQQLLNLPATFAGMEVLKFQHWCAPATASNCTCASTRNAASCISPTATASQPAPVAGFNWSLRMHNPCALIPVYNHETAVPAVVHSLLDSGLPCLLVDDGSSPACAAVLAQLATLDNVSLLTLPNNQGKGSAVMAGFREAARLGFTHALQVDADGQHDLREVESFIDTSRRHPTAVICGYPEYDDSVPKGRLYARYLTHVWVWINTLSLQIRDSMCGFRVYPLGPTLALMDSAYIGTHMDFDSDILVRLAWRNQPMRWLPTKVHYPADGLSHFRLFRDNVRISAMHTRLFFGMLCAHR